ncbi:hypothetical protein [Pseudoalteromonas 'SMAR']|uniref:hypothetical protein n=1 Tax=Pseudoalteromonas 'SMAR' TaxID=3416908 RepID=UPI003AF2AF6E
MKLENNIIYLKIIGPWNAETFDYYNAELMQAIKLSGCKILSGIVVLEGDSLLIPEVFDRFREATLNRVETGLTNVAFFIQKSQCPSVIEEQVAMLYKGLTVNYSFHKTIQSAVLWLQSLKVNINKERVNELL